MRGAQLAGRCVTLTTKVFPEAGEWTQLVAAMEATLRLHRHEPGSLAAEANYLHDRTGGMIGSLSHLIRASAIRAIMTGAEEITQKLMNTIRLDHAAVTASRRGSDAL